ncbi:2-dehydropantoate 2-reductase N-terminal domain-containing protein [Nocardia sp. NPDC052254]|uniref:ketopantoate reductase family protein n=1 Tax=Nocardia sp. NPDC052254 TaxID=3155681 RepID=UPI00343AEB1D
MSDPVDISPLRIAVIGPGGIGSTFAFQLAQAGHDVTVVARGTRRQQLHRDRAIVRTTGERAGVQVADQLDISTEWDLVLVTVLTSDVEQLLPSLSACAARRIMFMFNTFEPLDHLRSAVGAERARFGFPSIVAGIEDGRLASNILSRGTTTVSDPGWAKVFSAAAIPSAAHPDMQSWLRTHAAFILPVLLTGAMAAQRGRGVDYADARRLARAMREGLRLVRDLGDAITPRPIALFAHLPIPFVAALLWSASRVEAFVATCAVAPKDEPNALIDEMNAVAQQPLPALTAIRPERTAR